MRAYLYSLLVLSLLIGTASAEELRFAGVLGNSGEAGATLIKFAANPARGMGPVLDDQGMLWERAGQGQLVRYSLDGRLISSFTIPHSNSREDVLAKTGNLLILLVEGNVYSLPVDSPQGTEPSKIASGVNAMSCDDHAGQMVIARGDKLFWFHPITREETFVVEYSGRIDMINIDSSGTIYAKFYGGPMHAWKDGQAVAGFPKDIGGERPQLIGDYWYTHAGHSTIKRYNRDFAPTPGVVMGGASGSFIGFLPESTDLTAGRGMVQVQGNLFAITGESGIVQLLRWDEEQSKFHVDRRIGATIDLSGLAIDNDGNIWTNAGVWSWRDTPGSPRSIGEPAGQHHVQPTVTDEGTLCVLRGRHSRHYISSGPFVDKHGWSKYEGDSVKGVEEFGRLRGAALVTTANDKQYLVVTDAEGSGHEFAVNRQGRPSGMPRTITLEGVHGCSSLAHAQQKLYAGCAGEIIEFSREKDGSWKEVGRWDRCAGDASGSFGNAISIHSDGTCLILADTRRHRVLLIDPKTKTLLAQYGTTDHAGDSIESLNSPTHVAVSGSRAVVYDAGNHRIVRLSRSERNSAARMAELTQIASPKRTAFTDSEYVDVGTAGTPPVSIAMRRNNEYFNFSLRTEMNPIPSIELGLAGANSIILDSKSALISDAGFEFQVPASSLVESEADWDSFRWAAILSWEGNRNRRERLSQNDARAAFHSISKDPTNWQVFSLPEYERRVSEQKNEIWVEFQQPIDGKVSLVIEDAQGTRIRNLVSGKAMSKGTQRVLWDGLDENGKLVPPGQYRWRGISHPGIEPEYLMNFANGGEPTIKPWGPNHSTMRDVASNGEYVFFAAPVTEGGWALVALDADGKWVQGYEHQHGLGINHDAIAADDQYLYCAQDGFAWGGTRGIDFQSDQWQATWKLSLVRYDIKSGKMVNFPGRKDHLIVDEMPVGPGSKNAGFEGYNLTGITVHDGHIYIGSRQHDAVLVLDAQTGELLRKISVDGPRKLAAGEEVLVATDNGVIRLKDRKLLIPARGLDLAGIACAANQDILVSDLVTHQIHRFSNDGTFVARIGTPGGPYAGKYDASRIVNPQGISFGPDGKLWITEDRWSPKRIHAWDLDKNEVVYEKFGVPHYGATGATFDPKSHHIWIGLGCRWKLDFEKQEARPTHVLAIDDAHFEHYHPLNYQLIREQGRTYLIGFGKITTISEVRADGSIQDCAAISSTHHFSYGCNWQPPQSYIDAYYAKWPEHRKAEKAGQKGDGKPYARKGPGVLWVDQNNDGRPQQKEFEFTDDSVQFGGSSWGHRSVGLTMRIPILVDQQVKIATLAPSKVNADGVPQYTTLVEAIANATEISLTPGHQRHNASSHDDRFGRFVINSDPEMNAYDTDGKHLWSFANQWSGVHGSHKAPLPETGVMQGTLYFLGMAPFDNDADIFFLSGNHGRCFLLTSDGLYLDEMFRDVRVSYANDAYRLGGEIFGGCFGISEENGQYYVQVGHGSYRLYQLAGLDQAVRISGDLAITRPQVDAAEQKSRRSLAGGKNKKRATISAAKATPIIDGDLKEWTGEPLAKWDQNGKFPVTLWGSWDKENIYLAYQVEDVSPFVNQGRQWSSLFATGDTVDFQLATNATASPQRNAPVPGDKRIMIAPFEDQPAIVLYEHRKPGGTHPIEFTSPWRGEKVNHVERFDEAKVAVKRHRGSYSVEVILPLDKLGWQIEPGTIYRGDFGVTFGDPEGKETQLRSYWANPATMLVDDIPGEIMLHPAMWGEIQFVP
ncbi:FlgD immunoglobulin-like domain containing protein [Bremerella sp. T1]|uniref:FlgD immunoglobulin-like domain containing protein n=1 Tax=Bremerella sp. TYQ1 TaxID=3119568 RepID=UPI001CCC75D5|nr:FlgD immunoglobulin-like domain containing protein [Bremerella volcania]UBM35347.1 hypothetical protein LA756_22050 [Bremerella volcania]